MCYEIEVIEESRISTLTELSRCGALFEVETEEDGIASVVAYVLDDCAKTFETACKTLPGVITCTTIFA